MSATVAAVVIAAGYSTRLGQPKQNIVLAGETLLERAVRVAREAELAPIFVVLRPGLNTASVKDVQMLLNEEAEEGMASSIRLGVTTAAHAGACGLVLMTCDQVGVSPDHLRGLFGDPSVRKGSAYAGKNGVPAYFPARDFAALRSLRGDRGARDLLVNAEAVRAEELVFDIDTANDLQQARALFEER